MANWAYTSYAIEGPKETLLKIEEAINNPTIEEESSKGWEGNVLKTLGITWESRKPDGSGKYMRGFISGEPWWEGDTLRFDAEEAWGLTDFHECLEENFPDIKVYWNVEEDGMAIYATNDKESKYFKDRFLVDCCIEGDYQSEYFNSEDAAFEWLSMITNGKVNNNEDLIKFNESLNDDAEDYIKACKYKVFD